MRRWIPESDQVNEPAARPFWEQSVPPPTGFLLLGAPAGRTSCCAKATATKASVAKGCATGLAIISSLIQALATVPLAGTGCDLKTCKPWEAEHDWLAPWLRSASEDMRVLMRAYRRERAQGRQHPEWFRCVKQYADWLVGQPWEDGFREPPSGKGEVGRTTTRRCTSRCQLSRLQDGDARKCILYGRSFMQTGPSIRD